ncbi:MAG: NADH-quinone oxidoreductase subunit M, partial [Chloroflexi bacterium]|nr:NADH-quinone oxidoreductase subunit M [Chloroflexota bacterium]
SGFVAEFPIFMGIWQVKPLVAIIAAISIVVTATYIMLAVRRVFFGSMPAEFEGHIGTITVYDKVALVLLCVIMIGLGLFPSVMVPWVQTGVQHVLSLLGGA